MTEYRVRPYQESDFLVLLKLDQQENPHPLGEGLLRDTLQISAETSDALRQRLNWVLEDSQGNICGCLMATRVLDESELELILVASSCRRLGLAERMIKHWLSELKDVMLAMLEVRESNYAAINLYQKMGFLQVGKRSNYYPKDIGYESAILMNFQFSDA